MHRERPQEDTGRRWPSASHGEGPREKPALRQPTAAVCAALLRQRQLEQPGWLCLSLCPQGPVLRSLSFHPLLLLDSRRQPPRVIPAPSGPQTWLRALCPPRRKVNARAFGGDGVPRGRRTRHGAECGFGNCFFKI